MARKTTHYALSKKFVSYGHYMLTVTNSESGETLSCVTDNTDLIYRLSSEIDKERAEATEEAIAFVLANT